MSNTQLACATPLDDAALLEESALPNLARIHHLDAASFLELDPARYLLLSIFANLAIPFAICENVFNADMEPKGQIVSRVLEYAFNTALL